MHKAFDNVGYYSEERDVISPIEEPPCDRVAGDRARKTGIARIIKFGAYSLCPGRC